MTKIVAFSCLHAMKLELGRNDVAAERRLFTQREWRKKRVLSREQKSAMAASQKEWREKNPEKIKEYRLANIGKTKARWAKWYSENDRSQYCREYYAANKHKRSEYLSSSLESRREWWKEYCEKNPERVRQMRAKWKAENKDAVRLQASRRRDRKKTDNPPKVEDIWRAYNEQFGLCFWTGDVLGDRFEVDHIVPLAKGGTHTAENICLATPFANRAKGAKMPDVFWESLWGDL